MLVSATAVAAVVKTRNVFTMDLFISVSFVVVTASRS